MKAKISPLERYFYNAEADDIGGLLTILLANQGAGKTVGLAIKAGTDLKQGRVVFWRGQSTCQWILLAANDLPVTLWVDNNITTFQPYLTGDIRSGTERDEIDLEDADDIDVKIKRFDDVQELVDNPDADRVNVIYIPGDHSTSTNSRYYFYRQYTRLAEALNNRGWGNHVSFSIDEIADVVSTEKRKPFYQLTEYKMPEEFGNFRKNNISLMGTGHDTSDINYKLWKVKANTLIYMQGANVKSIHSEVDQGIVNQLGRGEFVIPGFQKDHFDLPDMPDETISWMPSSSERKLRIEIEFDVPHVIPSDTASQALEDSPLDKDDLVDIINTAEAADILEIKPRSVRRKITKGQIPALEVNGKYILSRPQIAKTEP